MSTLARRILARYLAKTAILTTPFDGKRIDVLIHDAETILKNYDRVHTEEDYDHLQGVINVWRNKLDKDFEAANRFLRDFAINDRSIKSLDRQLNEWRKKLWPIFELKIKVNLPSWELWVQPEFRSRWKRELEAVVAQLPAVGAWLDALRKKRKIAPVTHDVSEQHTTLEGFECTLIGFDEGDPKHVEALGLFRASLREYKKRAAKVMPDLIHKKLPLELRFDVNDLLGPAGQYDSSVLTFYPLTRSSIDDTVHVLSHEMAHHFGISLLSKDARAFWIQAFRGDFGDLDFRDVLKTWPEGQSRHEWLHKLREDDPVMYLQVDSLSMGHLKLPKELAENFTREGIESYLANGGNPKFSVPQTPITGYAATNPDEAFAEAVSMAVTYGPRAVHPKVREWLSIVLPGQFKTAVRAARP